MEQNYKTIFFLKNNSNKSYINEYFNLIPNATIIRILQQMKLIEHYGIKPGYVKIKKFQNDMFKIRLNDGNNNCRVYFIMINNVIYYLFGYNKKTQKTDSGIKIKINNIKIELLEQLKQNKNYLTNYINLDLEIQKYINK